MLVSEQIAVLRAMGIEGTEHTLTALLRKTSFNLEAAVSLYFQEAASKEGRSAVVINVDDNEEVEYVGSHSRSAISTTGNNNNSSSRSNNNSSNNNNSSSKSKVSVAPPLMQRKRKAEEKEEEVSYTLSCSLMIPSFIPNLSTTYKHVHAGIHLSRETRCSWYFASEWISTSTSTSTTEVGRSG